MTWLDGIAVGQTLDDLHTRTPAHALVQLPPASLRSPGRTRQKVEGEGHCRLCLRPAHVRPLTRHHLVHEAWFRSQPLPMRSYRNAHANIVPLCRACHDLIHEGDRDARRHLRRSMTQGEVAFVIACRGRAWLELAYPT